MVQKYIALPFPEYQEYMEEEWFMRESYYDYNENVYLIPINRVNTTSIGYKYTKLWKVNGKLIISNTVEEAIKLYKLWATKFNKSTDIISVKAVGDDQIPENYDVIISDIK
jgi:hypothetical protein